MVTHTSITQDGLTTVRHVLNKRDIDLIERVAALAQEQFLPRAPHYDREGIPPEGDYVDLRRDGLLGLTIPQEYGGLGLTPLAYALCIEEMARGNLSTAIAINMHYVALWIVYAIANEEQKQRYSAEVINDGHIIAACTSELGVDWLNATLNTMLVPQQKGVYQVVGEKAFCSMSNSASRFLVNCRAAGYTSTKRGFIPVMVKANTQGATILDDWNPLGLGPTDSNSIRFNCLVAEEDVIGIPGQVPPTGTLSLFTLGYSAGLVGAARFVFDHLCGYLKKSGKRIDSAIQEILGEMARRVRRAQLLIVESALECDRELTSATQSLAMAKAAASTTAMWSVRKTLSLMGGRAYRDGPIARLYREIPGPDVMPPNSSRCDQAVGQIILGFQDVALLMLNDD